VDVVGPVEALKICRFRLRHYDWIYAELERVGASALQASEVRRVESCVGLLDQETLEKIKALHARLEEEVPELKGRVRIYEKGEPGFEVRSCHFRRC